MLVHRVCYLWHRFHNTVWQACFGCALALFAACGVDVSPNASCSAFVSRLNECSGSNLTNEQATKETESCTEGYAGTSPACHNRLSVLVGCYIDTPCNVLVDNRQRPCATEQADFAYACPPL